MPTLDTLRLARPCPLALAAFLEAAPPVRSASGPLGALAARGALRRCGLCREYVVDTSALTREEADALAAREDRPACLAVVRDALGRTVHRPAAVAGAAAGLALLIAGCGTAGETAGQSTGPFVAHRDAPPPARLAANQLSESQRSELATLEQLTVLGGYMTDELPRDDVAPTPAPAPVSAPAPVPAPAPTPGRSGHFSRL